MKPALALTALVLGGCLNDDDSDLDFPEPVEQIASGLYDAHFECLDGCSFTTAFAPMDSLRIEGSEWAFWNSFCADESVCWFFRYRVEVNRVTGCARFPDGYSNGETSSEPFTVCGDGPGEISSGLIRSKFKGVDVVWYFTAVLHAD
jgi:hypothetical protein